MQNSEISLHATFEKRIPHHSRRQHLHWPAKASSRLFDEPEITIRHMFGTGILELHQKIDITVCSLFPTSDGTKETQSPYPIAPA